MVVPDYLDTQDILVRAGSTLDRSREGRSASRLSLGATHFLAGRLAERRPDALVTDQPQIGAPDYRIFLTINTFDVTTSGVATLEADWLIGTAQSRRAYATRPRTVQCHRAGGDRPGRCAAGQDVAAATGRLDRRREPAVEARMRRRRAAVKKLFHHRYLQPPGGALCVSQMLKVPAGSSRRSTTQSPSTAFRLRCPARRFA